MNKLYKVLGIILVSSSLVVVGCSPDDVDTGIDDGSKKASADKADSKDAKRFKANESTTVLGVKVNIAEVVIKPDQMEVGMNLENTNQDEVSWYPDQEAKAIMGDKQLNADLFSGGDMGGDIAGGVKQNGVLVFPAPEKSKLDPDSIKEIQLDLGEITSGDYSKNEKVKINLTVK